ncbi:MAG: putative glycolipid-binding domain-containing protein [Thaumarchaeota archaeon]|nr:putative glycolipid-binding domain-containing protein [Nitrososphaerota archaeon]
MRLEEEVVWSTLSWPGLERCALWRDRRGWMLKGSAVAIYGKVPYIVTYSLILDDAWKTRRVAVELERGGSRKSLEIMVDEGGRWWNRGKKLASLAKCVDVDLQITPCTNMLPINRLRPKVGQTVKVVAAWVRFPGLEIQPLEQEYANLGRRRYRYTSKNFTTEIRVDRFGLPKVYPGFWVRKATYRPAHTLGGR